MSKKVTIQDIADALGVSRNTVSKAINNADGLADVTREKILQKAVEMGYKQFSYVQSLYRAAESAQPNAAPAQRGEIALLTTFYFGGSHFATTMLDRLQHELSQLGYRLNTHHVSKEDLRSRSLPFTFLPEQTRGIICIEMFDWDYDNMLCDLGLPILFVDGPVRSDGRSLPADQLYMDSYCEISRLVSGMLRRGKRRIGFLGDPDHCQSFHERYMAYRGAMLLAGAPVDERFILRAIHVLDLYPALSKLEELPDLFVCANDFIAYDALQILRKLGKSVPEDVMLSGFDDAPESRMAVPAITTVHIHTQIMAYSAVQLLLSRMEEPSLDYRKLYTETELILRESTGDVRQADTYYI